MPCAHGAYPSLHCVRLFNGIIESAADRLGFHNRRYPIFFVRQSTLMCAKRELRLNMHAMKAIAIIAVLLLVVVNALELLPAASAFQMYLSGGAVTLSLIALIAILVGRGPSRDNRSAGAEAARPMPVTTSRKPGRGRDCQFFGDAAGKGPAGRFPDGRHQRA